MDCRVKPGNDDPAHRDNDRGLLLARGADQRYFRTFSACSLRLAAQDVALSRRKQGFESPRERHK